MTGASDERRGYALGREDERARVVAFIRDLCRVTSVPLEKLPTIETLQDLAREISKGTHWRGEP